PSRTGMRTSAQKNQPRSGILIAAFPLALRLLLALVPNDKSDDDRQRERERAIERDRAGIPCVELIDVEHPGCVQRDDQRRRERERERTERGEQKVHDLHSRLLSA